ncbi:MAG: hypothetical protein ACRDLB_13035 [Actinomycetota bacterium]
MSGSKYLSIYLNDHLGGAMAGSELAKRTAGSNEDDEFGAPLTRIAAEIEADKTSLETIMNELGIPKNPLKEGAGWVAEKAGRLKLNGRVLGYSPLSRVIELDGLVAGVSAKLAMWKVLHRLSATDERLGSETLETLIHRAEDQRGRLEGLRLRAADIAFTQQANV